MSEFDPPPAPPSAGVPFAPTGPPPPPGWQPTDPSGDGGGRRSIVFVALLLGVAAVAAVGVYLLLRSSSDDSATDLDTVPATADIDPGSTEPVTVVTTAAPASTATSVAPTSEAPTTVPAPVDLFTGDQIQPIIDEVAVAVGADPFQTWQVVVYPEYMFVQAQDPAIPANIDEYQWRGTLSEPTPVRLTGTEDFDAGLYPSDEVDWSAIPALVEQAVATLGIEEGAATHVIVQRPLPFSPDTRMRVFVTGPRGDGYVDADASGTIYSVNGS